MKRSEMVNIIKNVWADSTSYPTDDIVAECILKEIEKAGMLPPRDTMCFCPYCIETYKNEWEEE